MADQAWLEAFKAEHGWYPWEDPNLAAKGFSPEDAYAEHLVAKSISEKPKAPTFVKSWQQRYGMTDQEHPYLKPAEIPDLPQRPGAVTAAQVAAASRDMTNDTGPGYVPGMQGRMSPASYSPVTSAASLYSPVSGVAPETYSPYGPFTHPEMGAPLPPQQFGGTGPSTPMFEETPTPMSSPMGTPVWASASPTPRSAMTPTATNTPAWATPTPGGDAVTESFSTLPPEIQAEFFDAIQSRNRPLSPVAQEAITLMAQRNNMTPRDYVNSLAASMGVK
jgi:hypothetical protein